MIASWSTIAVALLCFASSAQGANVIAMENPPVVEDFKSTFLGHLLSLAGPTIFLGLLASTAYTSWQIMNEKSTKKLSVFPFVSLFVNCVVWSM